MDALHPDVAYERPRAGDRPRRGPYIYDDKGRRYLDGLAGLFVRAGRARPQRARRGRRQAGQRARVLPAVVLRPPAGDRAGRAARRRAPGDLNRVFFTTGGGEAVETAWKLAKQYFKLIGKPTKHKVISRAVAYHGTPQGALSITGIPAAQEAVRAAGARRAQGAEHQLLPGAEHGDDPEAFGRWAADQIEQRSRFEGPDTVAAVFLEPVQNAGGCFPPPPGYFQRVREICDRYDVLLVSDEVICAFGRLGHDVRLRQVRLPAGHHHLRQGHDLRLLPHRRDDRLRPAHGAVPARRQRRSRTATPSAATRCPRGRARQPRPLRARGAQPARAGPTRRVPRTLEKLHDLPIVGDVRGDGFFYGIELVKDKATKETFDDDESERLLRGFLSKALFDAGLYCRADDRGDPVVQLAAADLRPVRVRRDGADPARVLTEAWSRLPA